jgi:hypothetical protein
LLVYLNIGRGIRFEPLQSEAGKKLLGRSGRAPDDISSVVLVEKDRFVYDMFNMPLNLINHYQVAEHSCHNSITNHKIFRSSSFDSEDDGWKEKNSF